MGLGHKKGHVDGDQLIGGHTSVIDGVDTILKRLIRKPWFELVKPGFIETSRGGTVSVTVKRCPDELHPQTLSVIFRRPGRVQKSLIFVSDIEENFPVIMEDIKSAVKKEWRSAPFYDRTGEHNIPECSQEVYYERSPEALALLKKWERRREIAGKGRH